MERHLLAFLSLLVAVHKVHDVINRFDKEGPNFNATNYGLTPAVWDKASDASLGFFCVEKELWATLAHLGVFRSLG